MENCEIPELPSLVYQMSLLSSKGCRDLIVRGIIDYMNELERRLTQRTTRFFIILIFFLN